jgi:hypothetical protein
MAEVHPLPHSPPSHKSFDNRTWNFLVTGLAAEGNLAVERNFGATCLLASSHSTESVVWTGSIRPQNVNCHYRLDSVTALYTVPMNNFSKNQKSRWEYLTWTETCVADLDLDPVWFGPFWGNTVTDPGLNILLYLNFFSMCLLLNFLVYEYVEK